MNTSYLKTISLVLVVSSTFSALGFEKKNVETSLAGLWAGTHHVDKQIVKQFDSAAMPQDAQEGVVKQAEEAVNKGKILHQSAYDLILRLPAKIAKDKNKPLDEDNPLIDNPLNNRIHALLNKHEENIVKAAPKAEITLAALTVLACAAAYNYRKQIAAKFLSLKQRFTGAKTASVKA